jgi:hypothetical protein
MLKIDRPVALLTQNIQKLNNQSHDGTKKRQQKHGDDLFFSQRGSAGKYEKDKNYRQKHMNYNKISRCFNSEHVNFSEW